MADNDSGNEHSDWDGSVTEESESFFDTGAQIELEDHLSQHFSCPISHRIMDIPMITPSGHSYDFRSITEWLARRRVDPLTLKPLSPAELYPNRVLQDEIMEQLERLAKTADEQGEYELYDAARARLAHIGGLAVPPLEADTKGTTRLQKLLDRCAIYAVWCGLLAWEQMLVFTTSFGAILCLLLDARNSLRVRVGTLLSARGSSAHPPLLAAFLKYAFLPTPVPGHWSWHGRAALAALRGMLLLSVAPICVTFALGGALSVAHFSAKVNEVRAVEFERAGQNRWFLRLLQVCSAVTGMSSFVLFLRLCLDQKERVAK